MGNERTWRFGGMILGELPESGPPVRRRIILLGPQIGYGGSEKSFIRLANFLSRYHDTTVTLFTSGYGGADYSHAPEPTHCPVVILDDGKRGWIARWLQRLRNFRALKRQSDIAISFHSGPNLLNALLSSVGTPSIVSERGSKRYNLNISFLNRVVWQGVFDPLIYRAATCIVPASSGVGDEIAEGRPKSIERRIVPIEGYIDAEELVSSADQIIEPEYEEFSHFPTIVSCSRLDNGKGLRFLIDLFSRVKADVPRSRLLIVGDGPIREELQGRAMALGLRTSHSPNASADVIFAGFKPNPVRYMRVGSVFAFTSRNEGLPNVLIEALASGIDVISADCPWGPRSILAGARDNMVSMKNTPAPVELEHGLLLPPVGDPGAMGIWLSSLLPRLANPRPRRTPEERMAAVIRFDINNTGKSWLALIESLSRSQDLGNS
ncbi:glycosyltransferase [Methylocystis sp. IM2]|uniref:glycosyltransferase n=2 Tax=Methylocystis TaxID=133 RepID=UPI0030F4FD61